MAVATAATEVWSWVSFWETTLATIVGAAIALAGAWWLARADRQERYRQRLSEALQRVINASMTHMLDLAERGEQSPIEKLVDPLGKDVFAEFGAAQMIARGDDAGVLDALHPLLSLYAQMDGLTRIRILGHVNSLIGDWQMGRRTAKQTRDEARKLLAEFEE